MLLAIIIITSLISILAFYRADVFDRLKFNAYAIKHHGQGWRFFTYGLIHADWIHLFINMFVLYSFGSVVVDAYHFYFDDKGYLFYILLYLGGIVFSVLVDFGKHKNDMYYNAVGASGAVSAVLFASILLYPSGSVMIFPLPFPVPSVVFGVIYLVYSAVMARRGRDNIGHNAHFWGAVFGIVFTIALRPRIVPEFFDQLKGLF
ncbi:MAG: rhomboid family intramembrane serine protease [Bacteroidales bacterium]|nr:rhomboid family intramembrane serine protease [Bacteroidales bacterium]